MTVPNEGALIGTSGNYSLFIKRLFLSFAQAFFAESSKYRWSSDLTKTEVLIADKYSVDQKLIEKKPSIITERGSMRWDYTSMGQRQSLSLQNQTEVYTDLIRGSLRYNCIAKNGLVAEELALMIFNALTGYKKQIRKRGIHQIIDITIGEENVVKSDSGIELTVVPVNLIYASQKTVTSSVDFYSIFVTSTLGDTTKILVENLDYSVRQNTIIFSTAPLIGSLLQAIYLDAVTLTEHTETPDPATDSIVTEFYLDNFVYGYGPVIESGIVGAYLPETDPETWETIIQENGLINV